MSLSVTRRAPRSAWWYRLLLAAALAFGSEILIWMNHPPGTGPLDALLLAVGYVASSAALLDLTVRYRVRDLFGALLLSGIYSLAAALLLYPAAAFDDLPRTLITRVMGANAFLGLEMIGLFLALTGGANRRVRNLLLAASAIIGLAWGVWVRGWPPEAGYEPVSLATMLAYGVGGIALIALLLIIAHRRGADCQPDDLRLEAPGLFITLMTLLTVLTVRLVQGVLPGDALIAAGLLALCLVIVWFRGRSRGVTLLEGHVPPKPAPLPWIPVAAALLLALGVVGYSLPPFAVAGITPLMLIGVGFTAYGVAWLPGLSLVLGMQAYLRQMQARQL